MDIEKVEHGGTLYAIVFRKEMNVQDGVKFLTPVEYPLQVGLIERKKGYAFRPHSHRDMHYNVNTTQEFLYVEKGSLKAKIYDANWSIIYETVLRAGDFFLAITGGHSFEVLENVRLLEVKQGPYPGDQYAKRFKE
ncbi:MAG: hypothetical protein HYZ84_01465 [Candidatus Omnitrophica bacterium]|nr:hypothetical protein [Candidatus Omnitrophota bacterium]